MNVNPVINRAAAIAQGETPETINWLVNYHNQEQLEAKKERRYHQAARHAGIANKLISLSNSLPQ